MRQPIGKKGSQVDTTNWQTQCQKARCDDLNHMAGCGWMRITEERHLGAQYGICPAVDEYKADDDDGNFMYSYCIKTKLYCTLMGVLYIL